MAHSPKYKIEARHLYVFELCSIGQISKKMNIPSVTIDRWRAKARNTRDNWDKARTLSSITGSAHDKAMSTLIHDFIIVHQKTLEDLKQSPIPPLERVKAIAQLTHAFSKTMASAGRMAPTLSRLAIAQDVLEQLGAFIQNAYPQHLNLFLEILEPFSEVIANDSDTQINPS